MRVALDTNVIAYAEGVNGSDRQAAALALLPRVRAASGAVAVPGQALAELYTVLVRKTGRPAGEVRRIVITWRDNVIVMPTTEAALLAAIDLATDHRLSIWDSVMLAVAAEGGCRLLLSEDFQDGFTWGGVTVVNPFAPILHPQLQALLAGA